MRAGDKPGMLWDEKVRKAPCWVHSTLHTLLTCPIEHHHARHHQHRVPVEHLGAAIPSEAPAPVLAPGTHKGHAHEAQEAQEEAERQEGHIQHLHGGVMAPREEQGNGSASVVGALRRHPQGGARLKGELRRGGSSPAAACIGNDARAGAGHMQGERSPYSLWAAQGTT